MHNKNPFEFKSRRLIYDNPWIRVEEDRVVRPNGEQGIFGVVRMVPGISVLPVFPDGSVLLAQEYKYAIGRETLEVFSGAIDSGESALEAAKRELEEESGGACDEWIDLGKVDPFTTVIDSQVHLFVALNFRQSRRVNVDNGEIVTSTRVPYPEAMNMVMASRITHAPSCVVILKARQYIEAVSA